MRPKAYFDLPYRWVLVLLVCVLLPLAVVESADAQAPDPPRIMPHYYYDFETAFLINYAIDFDFGGLYTALDEAGQLPVGTIQASVWGFPPATVEHNAKSLYGQGTCIRYFIQEYQRLVTTGVGVAGINQALNAGRPPLNSPEELLTIYAASCANFVMNNMVIPQGAVGNLPPGGDPALYVATDGPPPNQADTQIPNRLYYWAYSNRQGDGNFFDDTIDYGVASAARSESIVAWAIAELAYAMNVAGLNGAPYTQGALDWWDWRQTTAQPLPPYNGDNLIPGIGRDLFYAPAGFLLTALTGNGTYQQIAADWANSLLGTGDVPDLPFPAPDAFQDGAYSAGMGRAVIFARHALTGGALASRDQWWDFGNFPARLDLDPAANPETGNAAYLSVPFTHFRGRELLAGTQRSLWFYYTFGENPGIFYQGTFDDPETVIESIRDFWDYTIDQMWDDTPGVAAWFENTPSGTFAQYKPCFAGGTDVPIADWLPPEIGSTTRTFNDDGSVTINVNNVIDREWPYLSWTFAGSGVEFVDVVYTTNGGATWQTLNAVEISPGNYQATIPPVAAGTVVSYYAAALDRFGNPTASPNEAVTWSTTGQIINQNVALMPTYGGDTGDGGDASAGGVLELDELLDRVTVLPMTGETPLQRHLFSVVYTLSRHFATRPMLLP